MEKNKDLQECTIENMKCEFKNDAFNFDVLHPKTGDTYKLQILKTREEMIPEKSKYYIRKNKIFIALYKKVL